MPVRFGAIPSGCVQLRGIAPISADTGYVILEVSTPRAEMGRKSTLTADQRTELVLRLLSKEEPAAQIARRAGISEQTLCR